MNNTNAQSATEEPTQKAAPILVSQQIVVPSTPYVMYPKTSYLQFSQAAQARPTVMWNN